MNDFTQGLIAIAAVPAFIAIVINLNICLHGC